MATTVDVLRVRSVLGRKTWRPPERFGPDGWRLLNEDATQSVLVTAAVHDDIEFIHASIANSDGVTMPTYDDLKLLHRAAFDCGFAYQVFAPPSSHINLHPTALHLWGRADGLPILPDFGARWGSI